ncbi:MAG: 5-formyltetrahydrofolate cyclo-ligase [Planctomycetota bacterium]|nr:5-formyltetrahydrofolate cyclo-ligase [Planctomycetota bacterium]
MTAPPDEAKRALRRAMKSTLASMGAPALAQASARVTETLLAREEVTRARAVLAFYPIEHEIDLRPLVATLLARGVRVALPRVEWASRQMSAIELASPADVAPVRVGPVRVGAGGPVTLLEPAGNREIGPEALDLVLVPGLAFDALGGRLGRGAGFYDRFLGGCVAARHVGVGLDAQVVEAVPMGPGDVPLHAVVTDRRWIPVQTRSA